MSQIFETLMLICFGLSWPISVMKSYRARTAKGKSVFFVMIIMAGYLFGISSKIVAGNINYVLILYIVNLLMVSVDFVLYFRNRRLDIKETETTQKLKVA
ncbi:MAG: hypothetical protein RR313_03340 [Anaerovoracaceae bacterium]